MEGEKEGDGSKSNSNLLLRYRPKFRNERAELNWIEFSGKYFQLNDLCIGLKFASFAI